MALDPDEVGKETNECAVTGHLPGIHCLGAAIIARRAGGGPTMARTGR